MAASMSVLSKAMRVAPSAYRSRNTFSISAA